MSNTPLKTVGIIAAGKLTLASSTTLADFTDGSKASQLSIIEGGSTRFSDGFAGDTSGNSISPLLDIDETSGSNDSKSSTTFFSGVVNLDLFQGTTGEYISESIVVSGFNGKDNGPLDVYLVISPRTDESDWPSTAAGKFLIEEDSFEVIGKATITAAKVQATASPFGETNLISENVGSGLGIGANSSLYPPIVFNMPIERKNLDSTFFSTDQIHMQAIAFPAGDFDFSNATVSPLYSFTLTRPSGNSDK